MRELRTLATKMPPDLIAGQNPASSHVSARGGCLEARIAERARKWKPAIAALGSAR